MPICKPSTLVRSFSCFNFIINTIYFKITSCKIFICNSCMACLFPVYCQLHYTIINFITEDKITECWLLRQRALYFSLILIIAPGKITWFWLDKQENYSFLIGWACCTWLASKRRDFEQNFQTSAHLHIDFFGIWLQFLQICDEKGMETG